MLLSHSATLLGAFASAVFASRAVPSQDVMRGDAAYKHLDLTHDLFAFHKNLTQIESISGNEKEVGEWLANSLTSQGYHVEKQVVAKDPLRFNVLAWPGSNRDAEVLISSHIDTVSKSLRMVTLHSLCVSSAKLPSGASFLEVRAQGQSHLWTWIRRRQRQCRHTDHCCQQTSCRQKNPP